MFLSTLRPSILRNDCLLGELNSGDFKGCGEWAIFRYLPSFTTNVLNTRKTRKLRCTLEARKPVSLEIAGHPIWSRYRIPAFSPLFFSPVSSRKSEGDVEVNHHGELSEWSKVQHSKCCEESNPPRVRIPDSPPQSSAEVFCRVLFVLISHAEGRFRTDCIASAEVSFDSYSKCA